MFFKIKLPHLGQDFGILWVFQILSNSFTCFQILSCRLKTFETRVELRAARHLLSESLPPSEAARKAAAWATHDTKAPARWAPLGCAVPFGSGKVCNGKIISTKYYKHISDLRKRIPSLDSHVPRFINFLLLKAVL